MRAFVEALAAAVVRAGGEIRYRTAVTRIAPSPRGWVVRGAAGEEWTASAVVPNVPVRDVARLLDPGSPLRTKAEAEGGRLGDGWGALVLNLGLSRVVHDDPRRLHRLVATRAGGRPGDGTSLFLSFSPPGDPVAPPGGQTLSVSTHVEAAAWAERKGEDYARKKEEARARLREALDREVPGLAGAIVREDLGTPRTFRRYTRRGGGSVGGLRMTRANFGQRALDPTLGADGLHVVGDTAFPGQGTLAVAMSAAIAAERLGAVRLGRDGAIRLATGQER
jgi:phytoene dehydrogenase-like protein